MRMANGWEEIMLADSEWPEWEEIMTMDDDEWEEIRNHFLQKKFLWMS